MAAQEAVAPLEGSEPRLATLVGILAGFAVLGYLLRFAAYMQAGTLPDVWNYPGGLCNWDCSWYVRLARTGYDPYPMPLGLDAGNWAFFPLMPMLVGAIHAFMPWPIINIASALSILFAGLAALVAWPLLHRNLRAFTLYAAFLLCGPFSMYFTTFYTEVLFVLLTNCVLLALSRSNYLTAGAFAALLSATRIVGVFGFLLIGVQFLVDHARRGGTLAELPRALWRQPEVLLAIVFAPLGAFAFMLFLHYYMGDALAFQHVQRAWGRVLGNPVEYLWEALNDRPKSGLLPSASQWLGVAALVGLALTVGLAIERRYAEAVFCLVSLVLPLMAGMASILRFVVALSPIILLAMSWLARWRLVFFASLLVFFATDYFFTLGWFAGWLALV